MNKENNDIRFLPPAWGNDIWYIKSLMKAAIRDLEVWKLEDKGEKFSYETKCKIEEKIKIIKKNAIENTECLKYIDMIIREIKNDI